MTWKPCQSLKPPGFFSSKVVSQATVFQKTTQKHSSVGSCAEEWRQKKTSRVSNAFSTPNQAKKSYESYCFNRVPHLKEKIISLLGDFKTNLHQLGGAYQESALRQIVDLRQIGAVKNRAKQIMFAYVHTTNLTISLHSIPRDVVWKIPPEFVNRGALFRVRSRRQTW